MIERDIRTNNEFYISHSLQSLIEDGKKITTQPVDKMCLEHPMSFISTGKEMLEGN